MCFVICCTKKTIITKSRPKTSINSIRAVFILLLTLKGCSIHPSNMLNKSID